MLGDSLTAISVVRSCVRLALYSAYPLPPRKAATTTARVTTMTHLDPTSVSGFRFDSGIGSLAQDPPPWRWVYAPFVELTDARNSSRIRPRDAATGSG